MRHVGPLDLNQALIRTAGRTRQAVTPRMSSWGYGAGYPPVQPYGGGWGAQPGWNSPGGYPGGNSWDSYGGSDYGADAYGYPRNNRRPRVNIDPYGEAPGYEDSYGRPPYRDYGDEYGVRGPSQRRRGRLGYDSPDMVPGANGFDDFALDGMGDYGRPLSPTKQKILDQVERGLRQVPDYKLDRIDPSVIDNLPKILADPSNVGQVALTMAKKSKIGKIIDLLPGPLKRLAGGTIRKVTPATVDPLVDNFFSTGNSNSYGGSSYY